MVDRLCADGLVERSADPNDRRVVNVALTQGGQDFLVRHKDEVAKFISRQIVVIG